MAIFSVCYYDKYTNKKVFANHLVYGDDNKQCINVFDILLPQGVNVHYETKINITVFSNNN